jgi:DNA polymerase III sliding clamp (beta) subunit (PCNA family)
MNFKTGRTDIAMRIGKKLAYLKRSKRIAQTVTTEGQIVSMAERFSGTPSKLLPDGTIEVAFENSGSADNFRMALDQNHIKYTSFTSTSEYDALTVLVYTS